MKERGKQPASRGGNERISPLQLSDLNTALLLSQVIAIIPGGIAELGALDHNLGELDARAGANVLDEDMDSGTQPKHERRVLAVENEVAACQKDLAWGGDGGRHRSRWWMRKATCFLKHPVVSVLK